MSFLRKENPAKRTAEAEIKERTTLGSSYVTALESFLASKSSSIKEASKNLKVQVKDKK